MWFYLVIFPSAYAPAWRSWAEDFILAKSKYSSYDSFPEFPPNKLFVCRGKKPRACSALYLLMVKLILFRMLESEEPDLLIFDLIEFDNFSRY